MTTITQTKKVRYQPNQRMDLNDKLAEDTLADASAAEISRDTVGTGTHGRVFLGFLTSTVTGPNLGFTLSASPSYALDADGRPLLMDGSGSLTQALTINTVNYIHAYYTETDSDLASRRVFVAGNEETNTINTRITRGVALYKTTSGTGTSTPSLATFAASATIGGAVRTLLPLYAVRVDGSNNVDLIYDYRPLWAPVATNQFHAESADLPFNFVPSDAATIGITDIRSCLVAIVDRIKQLKGTTYWYTDSTQTLESVGTEWGNSGGNLYRASGSVTVGSSSNFNYPLNVVNTAATPGFGIWEHSSTASSGAVLALLRSRGTEGAQTAVSSGDTLGAVQFWGYGTSFAASRASLEAYAAETWTGAAQGTFLALSTTGIGGTTTSEKARLTAGGMLGIGTTSPLAYLSVGDGSYSDATVPIQISAASTSVAWYGANKAGAAGFLSGFANAHATYGTGGVLRVATTDPLKFYINSTTLAGQIDSSGNWGFGAAPSGSFKAEVTGTFKASTSVTTPVVSVTGGTSAGFTSYSALSLGLDSDTDQGSVIYLHASPSWPGYAAVIARGNGVNSDFELFNRGTGNLTIGALDGGQVQIKTASTTRVTVGSTGLVTMPYAGLTLGASLTSASLTMSGTASNFLVFANVGSGDPTFTTRSAGTRIMLWSLLSGVHTEYAIGMGSDNNLWFSVPQALSGYKFSWYGGTTEFMRAGPLGYLWLTAGVRAGIALGSAGYGVLYAYGTGSQVVLDGAANQNAQIIFKSAGTTRFEVSRDNVDNNLMFYDTANAANFWRYDRTDRRTSIIGAGLTLTTHVGLGATAGNTTGDLFNFATTNPNAAKIRLFWKRSTTGDIWQNADAYLMHTTDSSDQQWIRYRGGAYLDFGLATNATATLSDTALGLNCTAASGSTLEMRPASGGTATSILLKNTDSSDGSPQTLVLGVEGPSLGGRAYLNTTKAGVAGDMPLDIRLGGATVATFGFSAVRLTLAGVANAAPATSGTTQAGGVARFGSSNSGNILDLGICNTGSTYAWLQATDVTNLATNYTLRLNPNGGLVHVGGTGGAGGAVARFETGSYTGVVVKGVNGAGINDSAFISFEDGTNSPFIGLTGTGATAGDFRIWVGGERLRVKSDGSITMPYANLTLGTYSSNVTLAFNSATSNMVTWNTSGVAAPTTTTRSAGTKLVLYPGVSATNVDYGLGIESSAMWFSVGGTTDTFKWYTSTTLRATLNSANGFVLSGLGITSSSAIVSSTSQAVQQFKNTDAVADTRTAEMVQFTGGGTAYFAGRFVNDAYTIAAHWVEAYRNASTYTVANVRFPSSVAVGGSFVPAAALHVKGNGEILRLSSASATDDTALFITDDSLPTAEGTRITYRSSVGDTWFNNLYTTPSSGIQFQFYKGAYGAGTRLLQLNTDGYAIFDCYAAGDASSTLAINNTNGTNNNAGGISFQRSTSERARIAADYWTGLHFWVVTTGGTLTERFNIEEDGRSLVIGPGGSTTFASTTSALEISSTTGGLVIPRVASDPTSPVNGMMWYNTTSNTFKCYQNGATKTFTVA